MKIIAVAVTLVLVQVVFAADNWVSISDFEAGQRLWTAESGPGESVRIVTKEAHSGTHSLAVTLNIAAQGMVRATWQTEVGDLRWSPDSRLRFWIKGSPLAQTPHGGILLIEAGGRKGGGDSHWMLDIPKDTYSDTEWHQITSAPFSEAKNPDWAPDADGKLDPSRISRLLFVAQEETTPDLLKPFTFYMDDLEATGVSEQSATFSDATVEAKPSHVTQIWRGFKGRKREHPAQVTFGDVTGWRVAQWGDAKATMVRSEEEPCYEDLKYQAKVTYQSQGGSGYFELLPPKPIRVPGKWNAACAWVYGNNWGWMPDPATPQVQIWVRILDAAGQHHRICLGGIDWKFYGWMQKRLWDAPDASHRDSPVGDPRHLFWGGPGDGKIHPPASVEAIEIHGGTNADPRTIYLESVAFYQDDMPLPEFHPERIANLPFPNTPDTILPTVEHPTKVALAKAGAAYVFTIDGDEPVVYRYKPATGTLSDLTAQVAGRAPFTPCAGGGPAVMLGGAVREFDSPEVTRKLVSASAEGGVVKTRWRLTMGAEHCEYTLALHAKGKSMIADWASSDPVVAFLRLGRAEGLSSPKIFRVPYISIYHMGPHVLLNDDTYCMTLLDWYNTEASWLYVDDGQDGNVAKINGGSVYTPLTNGRRNCLGERQFINVSSRFEEVLPNIPNPPSTQKAVTSTHLYCHLGGTAVDRFDGYLKMWRSYHRHGIEMVRVSHHEDSWSDGDDFGQGPQEYTMCTEAAPEVGDAKLIAYCHAMRAMGYYIGLYENFTDYNPLGKSWDERNCRRDSSGEISRGWPPTWMMRPLKALDMALYYPREVARKFGTNTAYRDCDTAYPPWGQVDFQAGTPGAGKLSSNFKAWGALVMDGHKAYGGPIFSEGGHHWFSAGLMDGNYAQMGIADAPNYPLLLDFDLRKLHPLEADISMTPAWSWGSGLLDCQAHTIAYGHIGFLPFGGELADTGRYYYTMQQLQARYTMVPVKDILYAFGGGFQRITEAIKSNAIAEKQVLVRYANGLEVASNCNATKWWVVEIGGKRYDLGPFCWAAADGKGFEEYSTILDGVRVNFVQSPAYTFADGGGKLRDFGSVATDGAVAVRKAKAGGVEAIVIAKPTKITITAAEGANIEAFDEAERSLGAVTTTREGGRLSFAHVAGAESYTVR